MHDQPKILSKVITRFESKVGLERHFLRWTTRKSQGQSREAAGLTRGESACNPGSTLGMPLLIYSYELRVRKDH
jgi:hypothetical protein